MSIANILLGYAAAAAGAATDAYFKYVTMLLPGNGTNGAQNNTFLDGSTNNFSITRNGNTTQGTFTPYGDNWSNYFNGSSYITAASNAALAPGTGDFTIECWVNFSVLPATNAIAPFCQNDADFTSTSSIWWFGLYNNAGTMQLALGQHATSNRGTVNWTPTVGVWYHIVAERQSGTVLLFIDGVQQTVSTSTALNGANFGQEGFMVGAVSTPTYLTGYISNLRYTVGAVVYTTGFTPSSVPLTTTSQGASASQVEILTCQSNRFVDNSSNAFTLTVNSSPSVQRFSPFSPSAAYSTTTNGGSGYFDGTGDYLNAGSSSNLDNFTGDFCLEVWIYPTITSTSASQVPLARWTTGTRSYILYITATNNYIRIHYNNDTINLDSTTAVKINAWNHVVANRSGSTLTLFLNGVSVSTATSSSTIVASTSTFIGATETADPQSFFNGYISDVRIVKGSSVYGTSNFTPPTAPLTAITNTQLLLNMRNAGIIDNAMMNDLETVGNAQISTTQSKFGGSSMYFDGTGDWLYGPSTPNVGFGTGPFTVEMWVYPTSNPANGPGTLFDARSGTNAEGWVLRIFSDLSVGFYDGPNNLYQQTAANVVSLNTWAYLAFVRSGTTLTIYVDGVSKKTATVSSNLGSSWPYYVGNNYSAGYTYYGYIDDLRITKGYARTITASPSSAFPTS